MNLDKKTVFITGADGFIGSHLTEQLLPKSAKVKALVQYNSVNSWGWLEAIQDLDSVEVTCGDIRDPGCLKKAMTGADIVFHLAALIAIPYSYQAPLSYLQTNVEGTLNILGVARDLGVERLLHTSTSEVYGTARYVPIDENHPLQPQSPYSASKIAADAFAYSYFSSFDLPVTIVRPFNTYGPRQSSRAIIPTIISQIASGAERLKLGSLSPTRDFNYVLDTCDGIIRLSQAADAIGQTYNIGSDSEVSIGHLAQLISMLMGKENLDIQQEDARLRPVGSEVERLWCNPSKIRRLTGFKSSFSLESGLNETIKWFSNPENLKHYKPHLYNV